MAKEQTPVVSIICLTYNHAPYIRECLDGFLMQETDFPIEIIIHDDASTDGTTDIVKEYAAKYPDIIKPIIQKENQYSKHHNFGFIMENCFSSAKGKYIAYCEGDDFWIDSKKLQKQVDFLNGNQDYGLVHTDIYTALWKENYKLRVREHGHIPEGNVYKEILQSNFIPTLSVLFRKNLCQCLRDEVAPIPYWDRIMWICFSRHTKFHFIPDRTSVYRIIENSATHGDYKKVLTTEFKGTSDLMNYLKKNNFPIEDIRTFFYPRCQKILKLCYFAKDIENLSIYWDLLNQNGSPQLADYIHYVFGKCHIPISFYDFIINLKKRLYH